MDEHSTAVALLFSVEPTDRALAGWHEWPWIALGSNAIYAKAWQPVAQWAPCKWTMRWYEAVTAPVEPLGKAP